MLVPAKLGDARGRVWGGVERNPFSNHDVTMKNSSPAQTYLDLSRGLVDKVEAQLPQIKTAADWFAQTILAGRMVHVFGSGHSRIMVEEMWPRYGSFPGFNPIVELSLTLS